MGKDKRKSSIGDLDESSTKESWEEKLQFITPISKPMATRKLAKKLHKMVKKAKSQDKNQMVYGIKSVVKGIRKGEKGICVMAGDVQPLDMICHFPVLCEESNIPYCFVPSKADLGAACGRDTQVIVLVKSHESFQELYNEAREGISSLPIEY